MANANAMKSGSEYLSAYASGSGFIHFVWSDQHGSATAREVKLSDVKKYLKQKIGKMWVDKGYKVVKVSSYAGLVLAGPVRRIDENHLMVDGKAYECHIEKLHNGEVFDPHLQLFREGHEVKHISTRLSVIGFLNHEKELTEQGDGLL